MACSSYCQGSHIGADCCVLISQPVQLQVEEEDIELTKVYLKTPIKMVVVSGGEGKFIVMTDTCRKTKVAFKNYSYSISSFMQVHVDSKTLHQQNPPVLNGRYRLTQVDLYNGHKMMAVVVVVLISNICTSNVCVL